ncbi:hypothetical protein BKP42_63540 [Rhodococcus erythropolis]|nr:hypothetical protein BKP42_63540 [Rhodococcus erythropolis]
MCKRVTPLLNERQLRLVMGSVAEMCGRGGASAVARASGMSRTTISAGLREIRSGVADSDRVRRSGAGRPRVEQLDEGLAEEVESVLRGDSAVGQEVCTDSMDGAVVTGSGGRVARRVSRVSGHLDADSSLIGIHCGFVAWPVADRTTYEGRGAYG